MNRQDLPMQPSVITKGSRLAWIENCDIPGLPEDPSLVRRASVPQSLPKVPLKRIAQSAHKTVHIHNYLFH